MRVFSAAPSGDAEIVERLRGADVVISGWTKIGRDVLHAAPGLRLVSLWATGLDNVDLAAAQRGDVTVCNVPSYATDSVAELALGLMLAVLRKIPAADRHLRRTLRSDWRPFQGSQLRGKTLGVVGTGVIGQRVAHGWATASACRFWATTCGRLRRWCATWACATCRCRSSSRRATS